MCFCPLALSPCVLGTLVVTRGALGPAAPWASGANRSPTLLLERGGAAEMRLLAFNAITCRPQEPSPVELGILVRGVNYSGSDLPNPELQSTWISTQLTKVPPYRILLDALSMGTLHRTWNSVSVKQGQCRAITDGDMAWSYVGNGTRRPLNGHVLVKFPGFIYLPMGKLRSPESRYRASAMASWGHSNH